jgi:stage II sporulation protein R
MLNKGNVMKYILSFFAVVVIVCAVLFCPQKSTEHSSDYLRIHITANSNSDFDQNAKYTVKSAVFDYLSIALDGAIDSENAEAILSENLAKLKQIADQALCNLGASYCSTVEMSTEEFPARAYGSLVLESGEYRCLRIDLGAAQGDNWWCVVFPTVCFVKQ